MNVPHRSRLRALPAAIGCAVALWLGGGNHAAAAPAEWEQNGWPFVVRQQDATARRVDRMNAAGPLIFRREAADVDGHTAHGFRPFWVQFDTPQGELRSGHFLYPLFNYTEDATAYRWSVLELIRRWDRKPGAPAPATDFDQRAEFEVFPFWFSRETADPAFSYRALFPIHGTIKHKLFFEDLSWTLFPLYVRNIRRGAATTYIVWPIGRRHHGAARGWGVWPIYNHVERPGVSRETWWLWPLGYDITRQPRADDPPGTPPRRDFGVLPFYARSTGPGYSNEDYLWPFFGTTERTAPKRYSERRYFWPFLVQGRGDRYVNRFAPFYTHSVSQGVDKEWYLWPLVRRAAWTEEGLDRHRTQFLYFLYWHEAQRAAGRTPSPSAELTHAWPLVSHWDNGAGRKQWQFPSPLEVFFPHNDRVRQTWSPLLALARHDQRAPGDTRTSLLWNAITWEKREQEQRRELHVGPLLSVAEQGAEKRIAIGNGLFGFERKPGGGWRTFWFDFPGRRAAAPAAPASETKP